MLGSGWGGEWGLVRRARSLLNLGLHHHFPGLLHQSKHCYLCSQSLLLQFTLCTAVRVIFVKRRSCVTYLFKILCRQCFLAWPEALPKLPEVPPGFSLWSPFSIPVKESLFCAVVKSRDLEA